MIQECARKLVFSLLYITLICASGQDFVEQDLCTLHLSSIKYHMFILFALYKDINELMSPIYILMPYTSTLRERRTNIQGCSLVKTTTEADILVICATAIQFAFVCS